MHLENTISSKRRKAQQIAEGLRTLCSKQAPGQCFLDHEIASACGVSRRAISYIAAQAQDRVLLLIHQKHPGLLEAVGEELSIRRTDRPFVLQRKTKKLLPRPISAC